MAEPALSDPRYSAADEERRLPEEHQSGRTDFQRDRGRLLHSSALRRLAAKTQVLSPAAATDNARNRLTHSLEVAQIGREVALTLGLAPDVVETACLAHDLGHPPFGHNGEAALNAWAAGFGGFEGNAQTLRVLTRLEPKAVGPDGRSYGLNLTRASLDASTKYPWPRGEAETAGPSGGRVKFGAYEDDREVFAWIRAGAPAGRPCVEAQLMDLSDDVAYSVHDFEDAILGEYIDPMILAAPGGHDALIAVVAEWSAHAFDPAELSEAFDRLAALPLWPRSWTGSHADAARLKNLTSTLIGRFARAAIAHTREAHPAAAIVRYGADIVVPREIRAEIAVLKGIVAAYVMRADERRPLYREQRELLTELADELWRTGPVWLDPPFADAWLQAPGDDARRRVIVDQIATLTDRSALALHERIAAGGPAPVA